MRLVCSGPKGEGCASNYSTNNQSNLSRHQRTCGRQQHGGRRSNSGRKRAPASNIDIFVDDSSAAATKLSTSRTVNAFFANQNMSRRTCAESDYKEESSSDDDSVAGSVKEVKQERQVKPPPPLSPPPPPSPSFSTISVNSDDDDVAQNGNKPEKNAFKHGFNKNEKRSSSSSHSGSRNGNKKLSSSSKHSGSRSSSNSHSGSRDGSSSSSGSFRKRNVDEHRRAGRWAALTSPSSQVHLNFSHQL